MANIGALTVEMRANTAALESDLGKARGALEKTSGGFKSAETAAIRLATKGFAEATGAGFAFERGMERVIESTLKSSSAFLAFGGQIALATVAFIAAYQAGQKLRELFDQKILGKESDEQTLERIKTENAEQKKFMDQRVAAAGMEIQLRQSIAKAQFEASAAVKQAVGDEVGARFDALRGALAGIETTRQAELRAAFEKTQDFQERAKLEGLINQKVTAERLARQAEYASDVKKLEDKASADRVQAWMNETKELIDQFRARSQARQQFEATLGQGASALGLEDSVAGGIRKVLDLRTAAAKAGQEIAFLLREGLLTPRDAAVEQQRILDAFKEKVGALRVAYEGVPPVVDAINKVLRETEVGNFSTEVDQGREFINKYIASLDELKIRADDIKTRLGVELPAAITKASPEVQRMTREFNDLAQAVFSATTQIGFYNNAVAGTGE